jgi:hypothetical protein
MPWVPKCAIYFFSDIYDFIASLRMTLCQSCSRPRAALRTINAHPIRASPCAGHATFKPRAARIIDESRPSRSCLTNIANVKVTDTQWTQATLPVKSGGLGLRSPLTLALPAFLASVVSTQPLQEQLLRMCPVALDLHYDTLSHAVVYNESAVSCAVWRRCLQTAHMGFTAC